MMGGVLGKAGASGGGGVGERFLSCFIWWRCPRLGFRLFLFGGGFLNWRSSGDTTWRSLDWRGGRGLGGGRGGGRTLSPSLSSRKSS